jgi:preprotein translocase subunit SecA
VLWEDLNEIFPVVDYATVSDLEGHAPGQPTADYITELANEAYDAKVANLGEETMRLLETQVMLRAVNDAWMEHLQTIEYIREGIGLRGYAQIDPLIAYKRETYDAFNRTLRKIRDEAVKLVFRAQITMEPAAGATESAPAMEKMEIEAAVSVNPNDPLAGVSEEKWKKLGRNDTCLCGSGKKFKACHYPSLRQMGVI